MARNYVLIDNNKLRKDVEMRNREIEYTIIQLSDTVDMMVKSFQEIMKIEVITPDIKCDKSKAISQDD